MPKVAAEGQREPGVKNESQELQKWTLKLHGPQVSTLKFKRGKLQEEEIIVLQIQCNAIVAKGPDNRISPLTILA